MKLYRVKFSKGWPCTVRAEHMGAAIEIARTWRHKQSLAGAWDITKVQYMGLESSVLGSPADPPIVYLKEDGTIEKIERGPIQIVTSPAKLDDYKDIWSGRTVAKLSDPALRVETLAWPTLPGADPATRSG